MRRHRGKVVFLAVMATLVAATYVARGPVLAGVGRTLVLTEPLAKADAIVLLSGGTPEREIAAADLYLAGWAPRVLTSRFPEPASLRVLQQRGVRAESFFDRQQRYLRELGVPDEAVEPLRDEVQTTEQEATQVAAWARAHNARRIIVVTSNFHTRRTSYIFKRAVRGQHIEILAHAAGGGDFDPDSWWHSKIALRTGLVELQKLVFYRLRYW